LQPKRFFLSLALSALWLSLPGLAAAQSHETFGVPTTIPLNVFEASKPVDTMFNVILWLTMATLVGVLVVMGIFIVKYRHRPGRRSRFIHGNNALESVWTLIPTVILAVIAVLSQDSWSQMKYAPTETDDEPLRIRIIATQFEWYFQYPGRDGKLGSRDATLVQLRSGDPRERTGHNPDDPDGEDDIFLTKQLVVPVNRTVVAEMTSVDVIHSFFLPNFRVKQDAVPGMKTMVWFNSSKTSGEVVGHNPQMPLFSADGEEITTAKPFDILCAELCGAQHYAMNGMLYVVSEQQFQKFIESEYDAREAEMGDDFGY